MLSWNAGVVIAVRIVNAKRVISVCKGRRVIGLAGIVVNELTGRVNIVQDILIRKDDAEPHGRHKRGRWLRAKSQNTGYVRIHRRTKSLVNLAEARTVVVVPIETTIRVSGIAMVDWDIGINKIALWHVRCCCDGEGRCHVPGTA
jgi:hypothetical protein